jgi:hypothetical protein
MLTMLQSFYINKRKKMNPNQNPQPTQAPSPSSAPSPTPTTPPLAQPPTPPAASFTTPPTPGTPGGSKRKLIIVAGVIVVVVAAAATAFLVSKSGGYPEAARQKFISECKSNGEDDSTCNCAMSYIEKNLSYKEYDQANKDIDAGKEPSGNAAKVLTGAATECIKS